MKEGSSFEKYIQDDFNAKVSYLQFSTKEIKQLSKIIDDIINDNSKLTTKKKGDKLESLIKLFFNEEVFNIRQNERTSTNEIDFLLSLTSFGRYLKKSGIINDWIPNDFIIECKNYSTSVGVTSIGKFYSLINSSSSKLGIFVSTFGISGESDDKFKWEDASGLIKKIALKHSSKKNKLMIIPISLKSLKDSLNRTKGNILELVDEIKLSIKYDIKSNFKVENHENEGKMNID